jgi:hypothetical protein
LLHEAAAFHPVMTQSMGLGAGVGAAVGEGVGDGVRFVVEHGQQLQSVPAVGALAPARIIVLVAEPAEVHIPANGAAPPAAAFTHPTPGCAAEVPAASCCLHCAHRKHSGFCASACDLQPEQNSAQGSLLLPLPYPLMEPLPIVVGMLP